MRATLLWLALFCITGLPVVAQATGETDAATTLRALEHSWVEAVARRDNRALDTIFDNALVYIEYGRPVAKGEYLARIRGDGAGAQPVAPEDIKVHIFKDTAIVVGIYREIDTKSGKLMLRRWRFVDTWMNRGTGWKLVAAGSSPLLK